MKLIEVQTLAARVACEQMTGPALKAVRDSVQRASGLPARPGWEHKATVHAEIFYLLAEAAGAPGVLTGEAGLVRDLMLTVGPGADGLITSSRQRLLAHLHAGDAGDGDGRPLQGPALHGTAGAPPPPCPAALDGSDQEGNLMTKPPLMVGHSELAGYICQASASSKGGPPDERPRRVRGGNAAGRGAGLAVRQPPGGHRGRAGRTGPSPVVCAAGRSAAAGRCR